MTINQTHCIACGRKFVRSVLSLKGILCKDCAGQGLFRKKLIITGITRMNEGSVCVSGIDPDTWKFVRPVFSSGITRDFVMEGTTQVVRHFNLVQFEFRHYNPDNEYHTEDWIINESFAPKFIRHLKDEEIIKVLNKMAINDLNAAIAKKDKSLFIVRAQRIDHIWHEESFGKFKVRVNFTDNSGNTFSRVPATDLLILTFVRYQLSNGNKKYSEEILNSFNNNPFRFIRIGLTREFKGQRWKQVTALMTVPDMFNNQSFSYFEKKLRE